MKEWLFPCKSMQCRSGKSEILNGRLMLKAKGKALHATFDDFDIE